MLRDAARSRWERELIAKIERRWRKTLQRLSIFALPVDPGALENIKALEAG
jgi:hypothetical protein